MLLKIHVAHSLPLNHCFATLSTQNLIGSTTSKDHPRRVAFSKAIGQANRHKNAPDVEEVVAYLLRVNPGMRKEEAVLKAKSKAYAQHVRTLSRSVEETIAELEMIVAFHEEEDRKEGRGVRSLCCSRRRGQGSQTRAVRGLP